ncbi:DUF6166 domain-containing protein [Sulfurimonas sp.]|jgi:DNA-binding transcriptional regulator YiaG|uniref:DUF6166 domain-containing protein n=1 Tax=Sulfurimonas sp. TaxID=2022749 RepID=UPI0025DBACAC|nr:DUF6166 domain-containing protein [Sulfurimonas sp.]MCK9472457.1 DUF6166 domain-containing protein [Sulfurimonas sp.]MDD3505948.1 DUF6166 domain-containing protein [Sulfurimonas sp.]
MAIMRNNHVFKGHRTLLGVKYVTYGEVELPLRYDMFSLSKNGFDWGNKGSAAQQLSFSILCQLSNEDFARDNASLFTIDVVSKFNNRDWIISAYEVLKWVEEHTEEETIEDKTIQKQEEKKEEPVNTLILKTQKLSKKPKQKDNVVKEICKELQITQKDLASILEIPEGTVSSWAVKNEIPRLGKKAIEFYMQSQKSQQIIKSYKSFVKLLDVS